MIYSLVIIAPADIAEQVNAIAEAAGYGPNNLSVPLTTSEGITHYGLRTWASQGFVDSLGDFPADLVSQCIIDIRPDAERYGHWQDVLNQHGMTRNNNDDLWD